MNDELLASIEREVLGWPGVSKEAGGVTRAKPGFGFHQPPSTGSAEDASGTSTTATAAWPTFRSLGRFGTS